MKRKFFSVTLIATSLLLAIGVFGCSDDKDDKGGYVSCSEAETAMEQCYVLEDAGYEACRGSDESSCNKEVEEQLDLCVARALCGSDKITEICDSHYATCDWY